MSEIEGVNSHVVDIDSRPEVAELYGVTTIPTVVFEDDGTEIARVVGPKPKSALKAALNT
jgi:thioredoxin-like negative regulator of GroEL